MREWIFGFVVKHINNHERKEANDTTQEDRQHHNCKSKIIFVPEKLQFTSSLSFVEFIQLCSLFSDFVENAAIWDDDDTTWQ